MLLTTHPESRAFQILSLEVLYRGWKPWPKITLHPCYETCMNINSFWPSFLCARNCTAETTAAQLSERKWLGGKYNFLAGSFKLCVITKCDVFTIDTSNNILRWWHTHTDCQKQQKAMPHFANSSRTWLTLVPRLSPTAKSHYWVLPSPIAEYEVRKEGDSSLPISGSL